MKLCLGTVQFGMAYGIGNIFGQPSRQDTFRMLDEAIENGIDCIDTAYAYGEAEEILGAYRIARHNQVKVISKLCPNIVKEDEKDIPGLLEREITTSLRKMKLEVLDGFLFHTPEYICRPELVEALVACKERQWTRHIGVSVYEVEHAWAAIDTGVIDYIQAPYSILDQRMERSGFLRKAKEKGVKVFLRSAFLQGLLMMDSQMLPAKVASAQPQLLRFNKILEEYGFRRAEAAMRFVLDAEADYLVFGVDTLAQLKENMDIAKRDTAFAACRKALQAAFTNVDDSIIFPSLWKQKKVDN